MVCNALVFIDLENKELLQSYSIEHTYMQSQTKSGFVVFLLMIVAQKTVEDPGCGAPAINEKSCKISGEC